MTKLEIQAEALDRARNGQAYLDDFITECQERSAFMTADDWSTPL
jgi:hypothetical protein